MHLLMKKGGKLNFHQIYHKYVSDIFVCLIVNEKL